MTEEHTVKIEAKRDVWISLGMLFVLAILMTSIVLVPNQERGILLIMTFPVVTFLAWLYFGTYYILTPTELICHSGPFKERIPYEKIKSLKLCENFMSSMALSRARIEIKQHHKSYITGTTYISPVDREAFLTNLIQRCPNLD